MINIKKSEKGFAALFITVLVLAVVFTITVSIAVISTSEQKILNNITRSTRAYYISEGGVEDALLRLSKNLNWVSPYVWQFGNGTDTITISDVVGGSRTITSAGELFNKIRKVSVTYAISSAKTSFFYGAQVGAGGLELGDSAVVLGNVFSNGSIAADNQQHNLITGTVQVAQAGNKISQTNIGGDAYADICQNASIAGTLFANSNQSCTFSRFTPLSQNIATIPLPISQDQINSWKNDAAAGGTNSGDYNISGGTSYLGPKKILGNLTIGGSSTTVFIKGTLWVTGFIDIKNNAVVQLDPATYGLLSGVIIGDGVITLENNSISQGSGQAGSYLMYLSTSSLRPALMIKNNAQANILYTSQGWIDISNNTVLREVTGYGIDLENSTQIQYDVGLQNAVFSSGPSGGWAVTNWKEIQ